MILISIEIAIYRKRLFQMINELPTIFEVVTGVKQQRDMSGNHNNSNKSKSSGKMSRQPEPQTKGVKVSPPSKEEDESGTKMLKMMNKEPSVELVG
ncbi:PHD finger protein Alfin1 [Vitis vinifera]|uniref:PHD finger protein Alfin1 n=1 Tax=Vitis vinifera TaxID=29760 RepID=A0A438JAC3_VITVI|nr:PHD finger protein Alfin1 [Vitis vinifera]